MAQFTTQGVRELFADEHLAPYQPVFEQLRELACPYCNAWAFNTLLSMDGSDPAKWHKDDTFREWGEAEANKPVSTNEKRCVDPLAG